MFGFAFKTKKPTKQRRPLRFESLEERAVMATFLGGPAAVGAALVGRAVAGSSQQQVTSETHLAANLTDSANAAVKTFVHYDSVQFANGQSHTEFAVFVKGAAASVTLDIKIDGTTIGQVTTDASGNGRIDFASSVRSKYDVALPANFPTTLAAGAAITVGTATGTLATADKQAGTRLAADLTDANSTATGNVFYEQFTFNGQTVTKFRARVKGGAANTTYDVTLGTTVVGQITTDANGSGELVLSSDATKTGSSPLPTNFPTTVAAGDQVKIGTNITGTLATASGRCGGRGGEGHRHGPPPIGTLGATGTPNRTVSGLRSPLRGRG